MHIVALPVFVPLMGAAAMVAIRKFSPRVLDDLVAGTISVTVVALCAILLARSSHHPIAYWMGGWRPSHSVTIGISFSIDPIGAGMSAFCAVLVTAALIYSWRYFEGADGLFHALMLIFLAGMAGFCLTGDVFNLVVFFELM